MAGFIPVPLSQGSYQGRSNLVVPDLNYNCYTEVDPAADGPYIVNTPGRAAVSTLSAGTGDFRVGGAVERMGTIYIVQGDKLLSLGSPFTTPTELGTLNSSSGAVSMAANEEYVVIVDGTDGYVWDIGASTFTTIADADFPPNPSTVVYYSQYFVVVDSTQSRFYVQDIVNGPTAWIATDFASAQKQGDRLITAAFDNDRLMLFGEKTTEMWALTGNADFPFEPYQGGYIEKGCRSPKTISALDNAIVWLAIDKNGGFLVYSSNGTVLSTPGISKRIKDELGFTGDVDDVYATTVVHEGNEFYLLHLPNSSDCLAYNAATRRWFEWTFPFAWTAWALNEQYIGQENSTVITKLDSETFDQVLKEFTCEYVEDNRDRIFLREIQLVAEQGVGNVSEPNPEAELLISKDGGKNFSSYGTRELGAEDATMTRTLWRVALMSRSVLIKFRVVDAAKLIVKEVLVKPRNDGDST